MSKPIPKALYPCKHCAADYSWPAEDLRWSEVEQAWVCDSCWSHLYPEDEDGSYARRTTTLAAEIKSQALEMIDSSITPYILSHWDRARIVAHAKHLLGDVCQECKKQEPEPPIMPALRDLLTEINCRVEHGAEGPGHLEYIEQRLAEIIACIPS